MREDHEALRSAAVLRGRASSRQRCARRSRGASGPTRCAPSSRRCATGPWEVTDADLDALRARYTEDQLFEAVVATVTGAADVRFRAGLRTLEADR